MSGYRRVRVGGDEWVHYASTVRDRTLGWARAVTAQLAAPGEETPSPTEEAGAVEGRGARGKGAPPAPGR